MIIKVNTIQNEKLIIKVYTIQNEYRNPLKIFPVWRTKWRDQHPLLLEDLCKCYF